MKNAQIFLLAAILPLIFSVKGQLLVSISPTSFTVDEGQQFTIRGTPDRIPNDDVFIVMEVYTEGGQKIPSSAEADSDFIGISHPFIFRRGTPPIPQFVTFTVKNDDIPEGNETFFIRATVTTPTGTATVSPQEVRVIIPANDDAYGVFSITNDNPTIVDEPSSGRQTVQVSIDRQKGLYGEVTVDFKVVGTSSGAQTDVDVSPSSGEIVFTPNVKLLTQQLLILPDTVPEMDEEFTITLRVLSANGRVNASKSSIKLIIRANDAPIRYEKSNYRFVEENATTTVEVQVLRGLAADGKTLVGPSSGLATVKYYFMSGTAHINQDFIGNNGSLGFGPGITRQTIAMQILSDAIPEGNETFTIHLTDPSGEVVLSAPSVASCRITGNDDHNGILSLKPSSEGGSPVARLDEDKVATAVAFQVVRSSGAFGTVSVEWRLTRQSGNDPVLDDISPAAGTAVLTSGETETSIRLTLVQDSNPEPKEVFVLSLLPSTVTGGARVEGIVTGTVEILDSDDAYGAIQFTTGDKQQIMRTGTSRFLQLSLHRTGGTLGTVEASVAITYSANPVIADVLQTTDDNIFIATFLPGNSETVLNVDMKKSAFLKIGATFTGQLINTTLIGGTASHNSPRLSSRVETTVLVTADHADGEIGFASTVPVTTTEPGGTSPLLLALRVTREGTSQEAIVSWSVVHNASITSTDIRPFSGNFTMIKGQATFDLIVDILPDDVPETEESFFVVLDSVYPIATQRIKETGRQVLVTIAESDNPGGTFSFLEDMSDVYLTQEGGIPINVTVVRSGGSLVTRFVEYIVEPGGDAEFFGGINVLKFEPGITSLSGTLLARKDGIPEFDETFVLKLRSYDSPEAVIGSKNTANITISRNDNPYGVIEFHTDSLNTTIGETKALTVYSANLRVLRSRGTYGVVTAIFAVYPNDTMDLRPVNGKLEFGDGQAEAALIITSIADAIPEDTEQFSVHLLNATGGAIIGNPATVTVNIQNNDYAVNFEDPYNRTVQEGQNLTLTVIRHGPPLTKVLIRYRTIEATALSGEDFVPATGQLSFDIGVSHLNFSVQTTADNIPEGDEFFKVELYDPQGDIVPYGNYMATITISANDEAGGVFSFAGPFVVGAIEGTISALKIKRDKGHFGIATLMWTIVYNETDLPVQEGTDFDRNSGTITFYDEETSKNLLITPRADGVPEHGENFKVELVNISGGASDSELGKLASGNLSVVVTVLANDDPYGVLGFAASSRQRSVAEDVNEQPDNRSETVFTVQRRQGLFGIISAVWGLFSDAGVNLPEVWDLIFYGNPREGVITVTKPRLSESGTTVLNFTGGNDSVVVIPAAYIPLKEDIESGFSISACLQPHLDSKGYVLAKGSADGSSVRYGLKIDSSKEQTIFEWIYSTSSKTNQFLTFVTTPSFADGSWHCFVVLIDNGKVEVFLDNDIVLPTAPMVSSFIQDGPGPMSLGGHPLSTRDRLETLMQNVRVYSRRLSQGEIKEILQRQAIIDAGPLSGIITFPQNVQTANIRLRSKPDTQEEGNELFSLRLISVKGGARLSTTDSAAILTVLKSDNANGLFGLYSGCVSTPSPPAEGSSFTCTVTRQRGSLAAVDVHWELQRLNDSANWMTAAQDQFFNGSGVVRFAAGERSQMISFTIVDDHLPELAQTFRVILTSAVTGDGEVGTTSTSGASIDIPNSAYNFSIPESDFPYGLIQFMTSVPSPLPTIIPPITASPKVVVSEEDGYVQLAVVRAQGQLGSVSVEWRTLDGNATSLGTTADFRADGNRVTFPPGERVRYINVSLTDDSVPEENEYFTVQLLNPTNGAQVGIGATIQVIIRHSDRAFGEFGFLPPAFTRVPEGGIGQLVVRRDGGALRDVLLLWQVENGDQDVEYIEGMLNFKAGQREKTLDVKTIDDSTPEMREDFNVRLVNASLGIINANSSIGMVQIQANDHIYGIFYINETERTIKVEENASSVTVNVSRSQGSEGYVFVYFRTRTPTGKENGRPNIEHPANSSDFVPVNDGILRFEPGQETASFSIRLLDDEIPEAEESFFVELVNVSLYDAPIDGQQPTLGPIMNRCVTKGISNPMFPVDEDNAITITGPKILRTASGRSKGSYHLKFLPFYPHVIFHDFAAFQRNLKGEFVDTIKEIQKVVVAREQNVHCSSNGSMNWLGLFELIGFLLRISSHVQITLRNFKIIKRLKSPFLKDIDVA